MQITLNGNEYDVDNGVTLQDLVERLNLADQMIVIEYNMNILGKENFSTTIIKDNDNIEIVSFAGGG